MEKVVYENEVSKLIAESTGGVTNLIQYYEGEVVGSISVYNEEIMEIAEFVKSLPVEE